MTDRFPALRTALGLVASALLATGFIAAATAPAYATAPVIAAQTV